VPVQSRRVLTLGMLHMNARLLPGSGSKGQWGDSSTPRA